MERICVYCGSSSGFTPRYLDVAQRLGQTLARRKLGLVYGGARVGLMGRVADAALAEGGDVFGVIPRAFASRVAHEGLTKLHVVDTMHVRKNLMFEMADAFIALPGGFGTLEEILEMLTWAQIGIHDKPCGIINTDGYFDSFLSFLNNAVSNGFVKPEHRRMLLVAGNPEEMLQKIESYRVVEVSKWTEIL
jgi:uncharacterized protein (TIGR00730 family)